MAMSIGEAARLAAVEQKLASIGSKKAEPTAELEQHIIALALQVEELRDRITKIETRSKPGPKPKVKE